MSINVKNREAEALVAKLRQRTGKGTTDLLLDLLRREDERLQRDFEAEFQRAMEDNRWLQDRWNSRPVIDPRSAEEILTYDENGLPT